MQKVIMISVLFLLAGCSLLPGMQNPNLATMQQNKTEAPSVDPLLVPITSTLIKDSKISLYIYHVAPADILEIDVWNHPEFQFSSAASVAHNAEMPSKRKASGQAGYLVNPYGNIFFPEVGNIHVAGKSVDEIRYILTIKLKRYIKNPQVNVRVADFRGQTVYVFGEVNKPGFISLNDQPLTIIDAITLSESFNPESADPRHIYVIRGSLSRPTIYWLDARTPDALLLGEHFNLKPGDVVYVSSALITRWNRVINQLLPTVQAVYFTQSVVNNHH